MHTGTTSAPATLTLPSDTQILITRDFRAPRPLVYRAYTTPELVKRWWGAGLGEVTVADIDLRVGGTWRYVMRTHDGTDVGFHGEYRAIQPNTQLVFTEIYEAMPDGLALNTATFRDTHGHTTLTLLVEHHSAAARDAHLRSGMQTGLQRALTLLDTLALSLQ